VRDFTTKGIAVAVAAEEKFAQGMHAKGVVSATLFPAFANSPGGTARHRKKVMLQIYFSLPFYLQLVNPELRQIGPDTQDIGKTGYLDRLTRTRLLHNSTPHAPTRYDWIVSIPASGFALNA
jgi:hypothetical protein